MTPFEYLSDPAAALVVEHPSGGARLLADAWPAGDGLMFADTGWPLADGGHPMHYLAGPIRPAGNPDAPVWRLADTAAGPVLLRPLWSWEGVLQREWAAWRAWLADHPEHARVPADLRRRVTHTD